jgi:hypothetical protein
MDGSAKILDRRQLYDDDVDLEELQKQFQASNDAPAARVTRITRSGTPSQGHFAGKRHLRERHDQWDMSLCLSMVWLAFSRA